MVADPGFELGGASWTFSDFGIDGAAHSGVNSAATFCVGHACVSTLNSGAYVSQTLATAIGQAYTLSFYVAEDDGPTSEFSVFWGGTQVADVLNPANGSLPSYVQYSYSVVATSTSTALEVHERQDPAGMYFDDFSVTAADAAVEALPEPSSIALLGLGLFGARLLRRKRA